MKSHICSSGEDSDAFQALQQNNAATSGVYKETMTFCIGFELMKHPCNTFTHYETLLLNMEYFAPR